MTEYLEENKFNFNKVSQDKYDRLTFVVGAKSGFIYAVKPLGHYERLHRGIKLYNRSLKIICTEESRIKKELRNQELKNYLEKHKHLNLPCKNYIDVDKHNDKVDKLGFEIKMGTGVDFAPTKDLFKYYNSLDTYIRNMLKYIDIINFKKTKFILEPLMLKDVIVNDDLKVFERIKKDQDKILKQNKVFMPEELTDIVRYKVETDSPVAV